MPNRTIEIYEDDVIVQNVVEHSVAEVISDGDNVVEIITEGPRGPIGPQGPPGFSGAGEPFFVVVSGSLYATTASLSILATVSSSLNPWTGSNGQSTFDLGSISNPWRRVYASESIFIIKSGSQLVELKGSPNTLEIGQSKITTSSFGFDFQILNRLTLDQATFTIQSASVSMSFNQSGILSIPNFTYLPSPVDGGLIKSGSDFFIGV